MRRLADIEIMLASLANDLLTIQNAAAAQGYQGVPYFTGNAIKHAQEAARIVGIAKEQQNADLAMARRGADAFDLVGSAIQHVSLN